MAAIPQSQHTTAEAVLRWWGKQPNGHRAHLGASVLGHHCDRHIWYLFRNARLPEFEGRLLRLFDRGKREEATVFAELRGMGVELHTHEGDKQIECRDSTGHIGGSMDGIGKGFPEAPKTWAILEIKTHSAKSFKDVSTKGVKESKPAHYGQMQVYMGLMELDRALYFAVNKDNDEIYTEWVHFDAEAFDALIERGRHIVAAKEPLPKASEDPAHWQCKGCQHNALCHQQNVAEANCRTCAHSTPVEEGAWRCDLHSKTLSWEEQQKGCDGHLFIPALIPYAEPVDGDENSVTYKYRDSEETFKNGPGGYKSRELVGPSKSIVDDPAVKAMRTFFGAQIEKTESIKTVTVKKRNAKLEALADVTFIDDDPSDIKI